tara:strand:+ start:52 stop:585 length:534 start_codon:yes stop_codon:yes gene_type:complete
MDTKIIKIFSKYQQTVLFEEAEFEKISDTVITDPLHKLVTYYIFEQHTEGNHPSQTDILYALRITHSTLRKILKKLIAIGYIEECEKDDARFKHYKPTDMVIEGFKIHTARHFKTLLAVAGQLGDNSEVMSFITDTVNELLGSYSSQEPYGNMNVENIKSIEQKLERLKNNSVAKQH